MDKLDRHTQQLLTHVFLAKVAQKAEKIEDLSQQLEAKHQIYIKARKQMEVAHSEKMMLQKSMDLCGRERQKLQSLNAKLIFQINQFGQQVANNEKDMNLQKKHIDQLDTRLRHKQNEIHGKERQVEQMHAALAEQKVLNEQMHCTIDQDAKRFKQMAITLEENSKEKMVVGQQLVRRNCELSIVREKLAMIQLAMTRGTTQYNQRVEDIRLLKTEINNLRMSNTCMQRSVSKTANMRHEVVRIERQLVRERLNLTAITEELKYPCRIHRWRLLIGRDPSKYQLIRKIQVLLKRNIKLSVERLNMEHKVEDMQKLCDSFRKQVERMPDPSIAQRLWKQQRINQRQGRKLRAMKAELAINEIDMHSRDMIINEYNKVIRKECQQPNNVVDTLLGVIAIGRGTQEVDEHFQMSSSSDWKVLEDTARVVAAQELSNKLMCHKENSADATA